MKKLLFVLTFLTVSISSFSQELTEKQKERKNNKVEIFTSEERDNLQRFYYDEVNKMGLSDKEREEYYEVLLYHVFEMARLNDKDKDFTEEEITVKFNALTDKMNAKMKAMLKPEQYVMHLETFNKILYSVDRKNKMRKKETKKN